MAKELLTFAEAVEHPRTPWKSVQAARGSYYRALAQRDSRGNVLDPGDPEMASAFIQIAKGGPILVDMPRLTQVLDARRGV